MKLKGSRTSRSSYLRLLFKFTLRRPLEFQNKVIFTFVNIIRLYVRDEVGSRAKFSEFSGFSGARCDFSIFEVYHAGALKN